MSNILIVEARFYAHISDMLLDGATSAIEKAGAHFERMAVPGALEIPTAIALAAKSGEHGGKAYDGYIALGCVIRGETTHYDYVCEQSARGLQDLALAHSLAIGFGILTVENEAQALARASVGRKNKGGEAARACLAMVALQQKFGLGRS